MDNHDLCRGRLKFARIQAKGMKANLPHICSSLVAPDHYAVFVNLEGYEYQEIDACCAFDARATVVYQILDDESDLVKLEVFNIVNR